MYTFAGFEEDGGAGWRGWPGRHLVNQCRSGVVLLVVFDRQRRELREMSREMEGREETSHIHTTRNYSPPSTTTLPPIRYSTAIKRLSTRHPNLNLLPCVLRRGAIRKGGRFQRSCNASQHSVNQSPLCRSAHKHHPPSWRDGVADSGTPSPRRHTLELLPSGASLLIFSITTRSRCICIPGSATGTSPACSGCCIPLQHLNRLGTPSCSLLAFECSLIIYLDTRIEFRLLTNTSLRLVFCCRFKRTSPCRLCARALGCAAAAARCSSPCHFCLRSRYRRRRRRRRQRMPMACQVPLAAPPSRAYKLWSTCSCNGSPRCRFSPAQCAILTCTHESRASADSEMPASGWLGPCGLRPNSNCLHRQC